jgi:ribonuclease HII
MGSMRDELEALSIAEVRARFADREPTRTEWSALQEDPRGGVQSLVESIRNARKKEASESRRLFERLKFERELWERGLELVAGCDEAGMSPLAGPVVAGAVILKREDRIREVDDSKKLSAKDRERLAAEIKERAVSWAVGLASPEEIDRINIKRAGLLAMYRALSGLNPTPQHVLMDAFRVKEFAVPQTPIIKGDALSMTIGAASILAKTHRDGLLVELDAQYPGYGFAVHKGYPVAAHYEALKKLGACPEHRKTFAPVREVLDGGPRQKDLFR